ncbi:hypothetical protein FHG87_006093 [Trinorchestia longiramus]|nr:hypothetical protein FHG87_006093 [Trinorchestia longiramus]
MESDFKWLMKERKWSKEVSPLKRVIASSHPLSSQYSVTVPKSLTLPSLPLECLLDPLSVSADSFSADTEPNTLLHTHRTASVNSSAVSGKNENLKKLWLEFVNKLNASSCSTSTSLLASAYLPPPESMCTIGSSDKATVPPPPAAVVGPDVKTSLTGRQRILWRLKQLELHEGGRSAISAAASAASIGFTPHQFVEWLDAAKNQLKHLWNADQRSLALKLTIQCVRLLSVSAPVEFYGTKFVLITELLDTLAHLVQGRLACNNTGDCQETGRNWLRKVSSIRELLPRLYLQAALLPVAELLSHREYENATACVFGGVRGVSDGIVNSFLRVYALRQAASVGPRTVHHPPGAAPNGLPRASVIMRTLQEAIAALQWDWGAGDDGSSSDSESDAETRASLLRPLFLYLTSVLALTPAVQEASICEELLRLSGAQCNSVCSSTTAAVQYALLCSALQAFSSQLFAAPHALSISQLTALRQSQGTWCDAWCSSVLTLLPNRLLQLGTVSCVAPAPLLAAVLPLLQPMAVQHYLTAAAPWLAFATTHCSVAEQEALLRHVVRRVTAADTVPAVLLVTLLVGVLERASHALICTESLLALLAVSQSCCSDSTQLSRLLSAVLHHHAVPLSNAELVQQLLGLAETVHNTHTLLTTEDERRLLSQLVCTVVQRLSFSDPDEQLSVLVAVRGAFPQLQAVLTTLVHAACSLLVKTARLGRKGGTSVGLARSCVAFCFISIASLECPAQRLQLHLLTASVARQHAAHGQADSCLKASIRDLNVCMNSSSPPCAVGDCWAHSSASSLVGAIAGVLVGTPNPPTSSGGVYLIRGLVQAVTGSSKQPDASTLVAWCHALCCAGAACQNEPVYAVATIEPLLLCGATARLRLEAAVLCGQLLNRVCQACSAPKNGAEYSVVASQALLAVWCWLSSEAHTDSLTSTLAPLWNLLQRNPQQAHVLRWLQERFTTSDAQSR